MDYATSDGSATTADNDYTPGSGTLTISGGTTSSTLSVSVTGDTTVERNESIILTLSNVSANAIIRDAVAVGTILNDEATGAVNDTGVTLCGDYAFGTGSGSHSNRVDCAAAGATATVSGTETSGGFDPVPAGQDAFYGRDVTANYNGNGVAGFFFTKIDSAGDALSAFADSWDCVHDGVTGLLWEVKTDDDGLRDKHHTYTWYNSDSATNGGDAGTANGGSCYDSTNCDTEKYVAQVNASGLCGYTDWRLPNREELLSIAHLGYLGAGPPFDRRYFSNTSSITLSRYWSSSPSAIISGDAWSFVDSSLISRSTSEAGGVRLVRASQ